MQAPSETNDPANAGAARRGRRALSEEQKGAALKRALERFPYLPDEALIREDLFVALLGYSRGTLRNRVRDQKIPAPHRIGPGAVGWPAGVVRKVLAGVA